MGTAESTPASLVHRDTPSSSIGVVPPPRRVRPSRPNPRRRHAPPRTGVFSSRGDIGDADPIENFSSTVIYVVGCYQKLDCFNGELELLGKMSTLPQQRNSRVVVVGDERLNADSSSSLSSVAVAENRGSLATDKRRVMIWNLPRLLRSADAARDESKLVLEIQHERDISALCHVKASSVFDAPRIASGARYAAVSHSQSGELLKRCTGPYSVTRILYVPEWNPSEVILAGELYGRVATVNLAHRLWGCDRFSQGDQFDFGKLVTGLAAHPQKKLLVSVSLDRILKLWDYDTRVAEAGATLPQPAHSVLCVEDHNLVVVGSEASVHIWDLRRMDETFRVVDLKGFGAVRDLSRTGKDSFVSISDAYFESVNVIDVTTGKIRARASATAVCYGCCAVWSDLEEKNLVDDVSSRLLFFVEKSEMWCCAFLFRLENLDVMVPLFVHCL